MQTVLQCQTFAVICVSLLTETTSAAVTTAETKSTESTSTEPSRSQGTVTSVGNRNALLSTFPSPTEATTNEETTTSASMLQPTNHSTVETFTESRITEGTTKMDFANEGNHIILHVQV